MTFYLQTSNFYAQQLGIFSLPISFKRFKNRQIFSTPCIHIFVYFMFLLNRNDYFILSIFDEKSIYLWKFLRSETVRKEGQQTDKRADILMFEITFRVYHFYQFLFVFQTVSVRKGLTLSYGISKETQCNY